MGPTGKLYDIPSVVMLLTLVVALEAVSVNPSLCPTNKIAPHRRIANWGYGTGRTFGAFYDLLTPGNTPYDGPNNQSDLQEQPQEDDPTDCGEIEDYDENDLSSITPQGNRRKGQRDSRGFHFGTLFGPQRPPNYPPNQRPPIHPVWPPNYPERPPNNPQRPPIHPVWPPNYPERPPNFPTRPPYVPRPPNYPQRPTRPPTTDPPQKPSFTKPPYWSGGIFGSNEYRPPIHQNPSDNIKPIHEYSDYDQVTYRPNVIGGPLGHVVGVSPIILTTEDTTTARTNFDRLGTSTSHNDAAAYPTRSSRPRNINNGSILGSFVDLLFK